MQTLVNIAVLASIYALIACGYVVVYRTSRVLSLAHGELMMLGAFGLWVTIAMFDGVPLVAVLAALLLSAVVGVVVYAALMRRMTGEAVLAAVLATIALGILLRGLAVLIWGPSERHPLAALGWDNPVFELPAGARISAIDASLVGAAVLCYAGLFVFLRFSPWGIRMRAAGQSPLLAAQRGISLHVIYALAWSLATLTGGTAGMLLALNTALDQTMVVIGLKAFPAALVGGLDSLAGAILGALIIATAEVMVIQFVSPLLADVVPFIVLLAMLIARPWGLFGTREELDRV
jgi:branched-chain amino acid transport system permease protein